MSAAAMALGCCGCASRPAPPEALVAPTGDLLASMVFPSTPQDKRYEPAEPGGVFILRQLVPVPPEAITIDTPRDATPTADESPIVSGLHVRSRIFESGANPDASSPIEDRFLVLAQRGDGSVVLVSSREGGRTTTFNPPIVYMPATLGPGARFEAESLAVVRDDRGREQSSGRARRTVEYVGDQSPPLGDDGTKERPVVRVVRAALDLDLFPARVVTKTMFLIDDTGIVGEEQTTRVRILGVPAETRRHNVLLRRGAHAGATP